MLGWRWDIFCTVVDNYGDIGVCWRLARQLAGEHGYQVRLWVDDLASFQRLCPGVDPARERQLAEGVEVRHWAADFPVVEPADVVVEAFACHLPERYVADMAAREAKPLWVNLEYLSAEDWVEDCHGLASPHPRLPLTKYFFFPGFSPATGGLLQERGLEEERRVFLADPAAQEAFWRELGLGPRGDELRVSLFGYGDEDVAGLLTAWAEGERPVVALVPEGRSAAPLAGFFGVDRAPAGSVFRRGRLEARVLPFIAQEKYDRLLWACDCNFVRGEDSFVRAQWAAKPLVWRIYPQQEEAHLIKLEAFLGRYGSGLSPQAQGALQTLESAWNEGGNTGGAWDAFWAHQAELGQHAVQWAETLRSHGDLLSNLVNFLKNKVK